MFMTRVFSKIRPQKQCFNLLPTYLNRRMKSDKSDSEGLKDTKNQTKSLGDMGSKYQIFRDEDSTVILDIYEERNKYGDLLEPEEEDPDPLVGINLERGLDGVFDIEDLVDVLHRENAQDLFIASIPKEISYVDYICVVTGKSFKHMQAIAQFVRIVYKKKMNKTDLIPRVEGGNSRDWMAIDLGNIALHIFSKEARTLYDLDSLWSVGPQHDAESNKQDPVAEMLESHSIYLKGLQPSS